MGVSLFCWTCSSVNCRGRVKLCLTKCPASTGHGGKTVGMSSCPVVFHSRAVAGSEKPDKQIMAPKALDISYQTGSTLHRENRENDPKTQGI